MIMRRRFVLAVISSLVFAMLAVGKILTSVVSAQSPTPSYFFQNVAPGSTQFPPGAGGVVVEGPLASWTFSMSKRTRGWVIWSAAVVEMLLANAIVGVLVFTS